MKREAKLIVIANQKGGCGKTTISVHLACGIVKSMPQTKVLVLNADLQKSINLWAANQRQFNFDIQSTDLKIVDLIARSYSEYDYIIVDCPPATEQSNDSLVVYGSLLLADLLIVPMLCSTLDIWATGNFNSLIKKAVRENKELKVKILLNKFKARLKRTKRSVALIKETIPYSILTTRIVERGAFEESAEFGLTVFELGDQKAITEVQQLTTEIY